MMSRQTMIALGLAIVLGLAAVFLTNSFLSRREQAAYKGATTKVAVAATPLAYGTELTPDKIRFVDFPNASLPAGVFTTQAQLIQAGQKRVALMPIAVNEPILAGKISGIGQGASIANLLPDGMRAASVRINDVSGVAGFIQPNDSVDVLITRTIPGEQQQVTDILLQNVRVIAIDQQSKNADGTPKVGRSATLEVNPLDAQKLALAQQVGDLSLVLRKPGEQNNPVVETVSMNDLRYNMYGGARYPSPAVVGSYGGGLGGAMAGAMYRSADVINAANGASGASRGHRQSSAKRKVGRSSPDTGVEIYHGTKVEQVKVGG